MITLICSTLDVNLLPNFECSMNIWDDNKYNNCTIEEHVDPNYVINLSVCFFNSSVNSCSCLVMDYLFIHILIYLFMFSFIYLFMFSFIFSFMFSFTRKKVPITKRTVHNSLTTSNNSTLSAKICPIDLPRSAEKK